MVCALFMMGCTTSKHTINPATYSNKIESVNKSIESLGYHLSGTSSDQKNEVFVAATSYSTQAGYGSAMKNDYFWYDSYRFVDSLNNTVSYTVKYKYNKDIRDSFYVSNVSVVGCDCSKAKDYNQVCGQDGVTKKINRIDNDQISKFNDSAGTLVLVLSIILGAEIIALTALLL